MWPVRAESERAKERLPKSNSTYNLLSWKLFIKATVNITANWFYQPIRLLTLTWARKLLEQVIDLKYNNMQEKHQVIYIVVIDVEVIALLSKTSSVSYDLV